MIDHPLANVIDKRHPGLLESLAEQICDVISGDEPTDDIRDGFTGSLNVDDVCRVDACNHIATGSFWAGSIVYGFKVESGNNNGFVWKDINERGDIPDIERENVTYALVPNAAAVARAIDSSPNARMLLNLWDTLTSYEPYKSLAGNYAYDKHFAPGEKTERYWQSKAESVNLTITTKDEADEIRNKLEAKANERKLD